MSIKKVLACVLALTLCVSLTAGFAETAPVELTYWAHSGVKTSIEPMTEAYLAAHPEVKITVSYYATDDIKPALKVAASSDTLPDMWFNWGGSLAGYYVTNGCTYDLTQYAADHDWRSLFNGGALDLCTLNGQLAGIPTSMAMLSIYYKKDVFEKCGVAVPTTFDELEAACAKLKENGVVPFATAGMYGWHLMRIIEQLIEYYAGPELHDQLQNMTTSWDCDAVIKALTKYQEWVHKGYFPDGFITSSPDDTEMLLASGQAAMDPEGQWFDNTATNDGLDINEFDWFPFPNGTGRISAFGEMVQLNKKLTPEQVDAAVQYITYIFANDTAHQLALPSANFSYPETQPHAEKVFEYAKTAGSFTITDQAFPTEVADVLFSQQDALAMDSTTPEQAAAAIQAAVEKYLAAK